jgi:Uncharacterized protein conserved in bacteria (DUF2171)
MFKSLDIQKDMEVVGLDGKHVGTVDHLEAADWNLDRLGRLCGPEGPSQQVVGKSNFGMAGGCLNKPRL